MRQEAVRSGWSQRLIRRPGGVLDATEQVGQRNAFQPRGQIPAGHLQRCLGHVVPANRRKQIPHCAGMVDLGGEVDRLIADLTEAFARVYFANARDRLTTIVFIHGVTSLSALGNLAPALNEDTLRAALRYGWQAGCALYACFGATAPGNGAAAAAEQDETVLAMRAVANGDEHVIKVTEACLHRHRLAPSPVYLAAVERAMAMIPAR